MIGRNYSISIIRILAMSMVFAAHFLEYLNVWWCIWFAVGIGIFFCMSGYLYGNRRIDDAISFYIKELKKVLVEYYVMVLTLFIIIAVLGKTSMDIIIHDLVQLFMINVDNVQTKGLWHLWFIPYILACYFLTPILTNWADHTKMEKRDVIISIIAFAFINVIAGEGHYNSAYIICYVAGFVMRRIEEPLHGFYNKVKWVAAGVAVITVTAGIYFRFDQMDLTSVEREAYTFFLPYVEMVGGFAAFFVFKDLLDKKLNSSLTNRAKEIIGEIDGLTFDIYLVHMSLIFGPLSLMRMTGSLLVNIVLAICAVIVGSIVINKLSNGVRTIVFRRSKGS